MLGYAKLIKPLIMNVMFEPIEIPIGTIIKLLGRKQNQSDYEIYVCIDPFIGNRSYIETAAFRVLHESYFELIGHCIKDEH